MPTFFIVPPRKTQLGEFGFSVSGILGIKTDLPNNAPITSSGSLLLDTSFSPTWTGTHTFNNTVYFNGNTVFNGQSIESTALNVDGQTAGDLLYFNGSDWTRFAVGSTAGMVLQSTGSNLSWSRSLNISTTTTSSLIVGNLNGVLKASSGVVSGNSGLGDLNDVTLSSPTNTQFLKYNSSSNKWVNSLLPLPDRALIIRFLNGVTPVSLGPDQEIAIVPFDPSDGVSALIFRVVRIIFQVEDFSTTEDSIVSIQITGAGQPFPDPTEPEAIFLATLTLPAGEREVFINRANTPTFNENLNSGQELRLIIDAIGEGAARWTVQIECSTVSINTTIGFGGILPISSGGTGRGTLGESNQVLAVDSTGSKLVYKTLQPGSNVTITQTPSYVDGVEVSGTITIAATGGGGGGGGTVNSGTANRVAYYSSTSSTVDSATHLQWDDTNNRLRVSSGPPTWSTTTVSVLVGNDFSNGNANGTVYAANISSGFGGNFVDYQLNNVSKFSVSSAGEIAAQKLNLGSNAASTSTTTGALIVTGGVGIGGALNLGTQLSVANGGTGVTSATNGQLLIGNSSGTFTLSTLTAGSGINITNGNGSITINSTGLASLNTLTGTSQTLAVGTSGSDFNIASTSSTHTFNLPDAGTSSRGVVSTSAQSFAGQKTFSSSAVSQKFYTGLDGYFGGDPTVFTYTGTTGSIQFGIKKSDDITHFAGIKIIEKTSPTLGSGYLYGDIVFYTDAEGEELSTERLRIDGAGLITAKKDVNIEGTLSLINNPLATTSGGTGLNTIGTSNSVLGVNNAASGLEYKTLTAGSNISITHGTGSVTIAATGTTGMVSLNTLTGTSQTFANDTNVTIVSSTATNTHTITWSGQLSTSRGGTGLGTLGTSNSLLGVTNGASGLEYKTLTAGSNISITHGTGSITIAATGTTGIVSLNTLTGTSQTFVNDTNVTVISSSVANTHTITWSGQLSTSRGGTGLGTLGTSNSLLGVDNGAGGLEYKTLTAGSNISITHGTGSITISATGTTGIVSLNTLTGTSQTFTNDTNVTIVSSSATNTHAITWSGQLSTSRGGTGLGTLGTSNSVLGVTNGASGLEYKTLTAGSNISITHGTGSITIAATDTVGITSLNSLTGTSQTFVNDTNFTIVSSSATNTHTLTWSGQLSTSRGGTGLNSLGTSNSLLGVDNGASGLEYKTLTAGSNISITHGTGSITIAATGTTGISSLNSVTGTSQTFVDDTNVTMVSSSVANTHTITWSGQLSTSRGGTGLGTIGTSNSVLGVTNGASGLEYKTLTAGSNISITHGTGSITITATGTTGISSLNNVTGTSQTFVDDTNVTVVSSSAANTHTITWSGQLSVSRGGTGTSSITGLIKGSGTSAFTAASSGVDYAPPTSGTSLLYGNNAGGFSNVTVSTGLSFSGGTLSNTGVTSVSLSLPNIFALSTSTVTTTGTLTATLSTTSANYVFAGPTTGVATTPAFRALVASDIPSLNYAPPTSGTSLLYGNNAGGFSNATVSTGLSFTGGTLSNTGVTSVSLSLPNIFSISTSTVTTTGTLTATLSTTAANYVFAGPTTGLATTPAFRALVAADIPSLSYAPLTSGTSILYGNNAGGFSNVTVSTGLSFSAGTLSNTGVTSVSLSLPNIFTISTSTVTTTGTLTATLSTTSANYVFAGPTTGSATTPAFRALVSADIPSLNYAPQTTGTSLLYGNNTGGFSNATVSTGLSFTGGTLSNTGVTSVSLSLPNIFTISTSTVTTTGTLTATLSTTAANTLFAGPTTGSATTPAFRTLVAADIPSLDASKITTGTIATARLATGTATTTTFLRGDQTWATVSGGSPGGSNGQIQFNNSSSFGGATYASWNTTNNSFNLTATPTATTISAILQIGSAFTAETPALGDFTGSTSGTIIAVNTATSFVGNQIDLQNFGSSIFKVDYTGKTTIAATTASTSSVTGALVVGGGMGVSGSLNIGSGLSISGLTTLTYTSEKLSTKTSATGTVTHDLTTGSIFYHSSISNNFTANITNVPSTDDRAIGVTLVLSQGGTAYMVTALQIDGNAQTIKWVNNTVPSGAANKVDVVGFSFIRTGSSWTVLGQYSTYG
jgi:hypothetical protein